MSDGIDYLAARGLGETFHDEIGELAEARLPPDYHARLRALELSCEVARLTHNAPDRFLILTRAADFHSFLIANPTADDEVVHTDG